MAERHCFLWVTCCTAVYLSNIAIITNSIILSCFYSSLLSCRFIIWTWCSIQPIPRISTKILVSIISSPPLQFYLSGSIVLKLKHCRRISKGGDSEQNADTCKSQHCTYESNNCHTNVSKTTANKSALMRRVVEAGAWSCWNQSFKSAITPAQYEFIAFQFNSGRTHMYHTFSNVLSLYF